MRGRVKYQLILDEYIDKQKHMTPITNKDFYTYVANKFGDTNDEVKAVVNMALSRLIKSRKDFFRLQSGIYYRAKKTAFGYAKLDKASVIRKKYLTDSDQIIGYETGLSLLNKCGLTTQVPAHIYIATNKHKGRGHFKIENLDVYLSKPLMKVDANNYLYLQALELIGMLTKNKEYVLVKHPHRHIYDYIMNQGLNVAMLMYYAGMCNINFADEIIMVFYRGRSNEILPNKEKAH